MSVVLDGGQPLIDWVAARMPCVVDFSNAAAIGVTRDNKLIAGVVFNNLALNEQGYPHDIDVSIAADSPRWATKENIFTILSYPFNQLGCARVSAYQPKGHKRARRLVEGIGFQYEGKKRQGLPNGQDMVIYGMLRDEFLNSKWVK